ncbi:HDOD domain-containing protein [Phycisphaera mikurensis]|nr:HDOD domain-containing protein [Phycisphaera mikurensis]MBB6443281.1 putative nucleotidyltransferase with HDIG domain [Phycisphaera mikurensis]
MSPATATTDAETEAMIRGSIDEISHIATLPEVTLKIIELVDNPDSTAQDLNKIISHDPALGARILKVVNSAFYGLPGQIGSINRAIVLLGLNAVKNIAIAASLTKLFRGGKICDGFDARELWSHCIATATACRLLAERAKLGKGDEAFLAGLIHDIGIMVEIQARRTDFVEAVNHAVASEGTFRASEIAVLGATHEQFGAALCKTWKFPETFQNVAGFHHEPRLLPEGARALAVLVHIADHLTKTLELGFTLDVEGELDPALVAELNLTQADLDEIATGLPEAIAEAQGVFSGG